jgi:hypothetical protein
MARNLVKGKIAAQPGQRLIAMACTLPDNKPESAFALRFAVNALY